MLAMLKNNKGNSLIGALVVMVVLAGAAASVVSTSGVDTRSYTNDMQSQQALAVGNAGLQWALDRVNNGYDPTVANKEFGAGYFNVDSTADSSLITVTAFVGDAKRVQSINADYARNCFDVEGYEVVVSGNTVSGIELEKDCNDIGIVASVTVDWNSSECAIGVECEVDDDEVDDVDDDCEEDEDENNGHGNDCDHDDEGNPGNSFNMPSFVVNQALAKNWDWNNDDDEDANDDDEGDGNDNQDDDHEDNANEDDSDDHDNGNGNDDDSEDEDVVVSCMAEADAAVDLAVCAADSDGLTLTGITLAGDSIFDAGVVPEGSAAAANGETVDISDAAVDEDGSHLMAFEFSGDVTPGTWFTVTIQFVDGSSATSTFKAGTEAGVEPVEEGEAEADQGDAVAGFSVDNGSVVVDAQYQVDVQMLGSAITCGAGGSEIDVTADLCIDGVCSDLFNGADIDGGELYSVVNNTDDADYTIRATASSASCGNFSATYESTDTVQVRTLINGEAAPALEGYGGQQSVQDFLDAYVDDAGNVVLASNQVIMLFEMGTDVSADPDSTAADFQDLVVLMTITEL